MPHYTFKDTNTGKVFDMEMKISEREEFLRDNPHLEQIIRRVNFADPLLLGKKQLDNAFRDRLQDIQETHPGSKINTGNVGDV